jgi:two-component system sensor histidine kinase UhpB
MTLNSLASQFEKWSNKVTEPFDQLHYVFSRHEVGDHDIDPIAGLNIFRIMQEAVHNALKHSGATELSASMICDESCLNIVISDNGKGMSGESEEGTGLSSMKQRAEAMNATLSVVSVPGGGTRVELKLDINTLKG